MKNQQIRQENPGNNLTAEIPPSQKRYAFRDLPTEIQKKLLYLQNTDGDFLKTSEKGVVLARIIALLLLLNIFGAFAASFNFSPFDAARAFGFAVGFVLFALWTVYFGRGVYLSIKSPIKNHAYLTRTQLIETQKGTVKYRELKDVVEIVLDKAAARTVSGGSDYILKLKFGDGDWCEYPFERWWKERLAEAEQWRERAVLWRDEAVSAFERGDKAYFDSYDVFQKSPMANVPVLEDGFRFLSPRFLFKITLALLACFLVVKIITKLL